MEEQHATGQAYMDWPTFKTQYEKGFFGLSNLNFEAQVEVRPSSVLVTRGAVRYSFCFIFQFELVFLKYV